jgi:hypothetical protein
MMQAAGNAGGAVEIALTISGDTHNYNIWDNRGGTYEAGNSILTLTINSGIYVGSTSTGTYALTIPTNFHADDQIFIINNGVIIGMGGNGGTGGQGNINADRAGIAGSAGGHAIYAQRAVTITNNGTVAGGGGGGGGAGNERYCSSYFYGSCINYDSYRGAGGGGGAGYNAGSGGGTNSSSGSSGPGSAGSKTGGGSGGTGANGLGGGGNGGGPGSAGSAGSANGGGSGGGGASGNYAVGNSSITWATTGTRLGGVS